MRNKIVLVECVFEAGIDAVWKALTDKDQMKHWYILVDDFEPQVGFKFQFWGGEEGDEKWKHFCEITEVEFGKKISYSWKYEGIIGISDVTFELFEQDSTTKLRLSHSGIENFPADLDELSFENFEMGWHRAIHETLKPFLENKSEV